MGRIVYSAETTGDLVSPGLNRAFKKLAAESNILPVVLSPYGGDRTPAENDQLRRQGLTSTPWSLSDHGKKRCAVDINNWRAIQNKIGAARFKAILAAEGWYNHQINGAPFPSEPWHYSNHKSAAWLAGRTVTAAGASITRTLTPSTKDDTMTLVYTNDKKIPADKRYIVVGETSWLHVVAARAAWMKKLYPRVSLTRGQVQAEFQQLNQRRAQSNLPPLTDSVIG